MERLEQISRNTREILQRLPPGVTLLGAAKGRTPDEIRAALAGGLVELGHNYVQEAARSIDAVGRHCARWHLIGHLQRNKARRAAELFDQIDTLDSAALAEELDKRCAAAGTVLPVLLEINSAAEERKSGVLPDEAEALARRVAGLEHLRLEGLMTMGPLDEDPRRCRQAFRLTRQLLEHLRSLHLAGAPLGQLSMGMSSSWQAAVEEGATQVRLGTALFGPRPA